ncbi:MAG: hypothetical protein AB1Z21_07805, partial [Synechococcaceae cyanobacterium]
MRHLIDLRQFIGCRGRAGALGRSARRALGLAATLMLSISLPMTGKGPPTWMDGPLAFAEDERTLPG